MYEPRVPDALMDQLGTCRAVCVLTGSGISAESGVPTFRDAQTGLWARFDPQALATPEAFREDPALVWRWYRWRRKLIADAEPNPAHTALVTLAARLPNLTLVTQNVDGLHQRAGSADVIEFHGNIFVDRCSAEGCPGTAYSADEAVPICQQCGEAMRPGVVWFGESIPALAMTSAAAAVRECDVFFSIGTASAVWPAAGFVETARAAGATVVEVNPEPTALTPLADHVLRGKAGVLLPKLLDSLTL